MFGDEQLLKDETVQKMLKKAIPDIDSTVGLYFFNSKDKYDLWGHDGGESGVTIEVIFSKDTGIGAIVLCNKGDAEFETLMQKLYEFGVNAIVKQ